MTVTKEGLEELLVAAKPLMEWLWTHGHPYCSALVTSDCVEITEGVACVPYRRIG